MEKRVLILAISLILILNLFSVSALEARIGNARMILRVEQGDTIERSIRVINSNNISVNITLFASGDLADDTEIIDKSFILVPDEEKKAKFKIKVTKAGTTETKINIQFTPTDEGNGVGLSSTIIIIAEENSIWNDWFGDDENENDDNSNEDSVNVITGDATSKSGNSNPAAIFLLSILGIFLILLIVLLIVLLNKKKRAIKSKKRVKKSA